SARADRQGPAACLSSAQTSSPPNAGPRAETTIPAPEWQRPASWQRLRPPRPPLQIVCAFAPPEPRARRAGQGRDPPTYAAAPGSAAGDGPGTGPATPPPPPPTRSGPLGPWPGACPGSPPASRECPG